MLAHYFPGMGEWRNWRDWRLDLVEHCLAYLNLVPEYPAHVVVMHRQE